MHGFGRYGSAWLAILLLACWAGKAEAGASARDAPKKVPKSVSSGVTLERIHRGLSKPVGLEYFKGDSKKRLFVVEQTGTIRAIEKGAVAKSPLLDISKQISTEHGEQGLLGLAFHPDFHRNRRLFVNYTDRDGATRVVEYEASKSEPLVVDPKSAKLHLKIDQPWRNHNGGYLAFGPDGGLYVGMGDGGAAGDPRRAAQDTKSQLGKMLRVDVKTGKTKTVQSGLRNPWRFTFDGKTGDLYIADVGQDVWEEINVVSKGDLMGANFGWSIREGAHCYKKKTCQTKSLVDPVVEYNHKTGCSVTGGEVYRGKALPALDGVYFYADFCTAILRSFRYQDGMRVDHWDWKEALDPRFRLSQLSAFASDEEGELYLLSLDGLLFKLRPSSK